VLDDVLLQCLTQHSYGGLSVCLIPTYPIAIFLLKFHHILYRLYAKNEDLGHYIISGMLTTLDINNIYKYHEMACLHVQKLHFTVT